MQPEVDHEPWHPDATMACDMDSPLFDVTFCIVDLETTGGSPEVDRITEIGAVKVRGGEVIGEFATLVRPGRELPAEVSALTGITAEMVAAAPSLGAALPAFLDFSHGSVLVAHNTGFDMSFLRAACQAADRPWPEPVIVDTVRLARLLVPRDEVLNHRLATLAAWCGATTTPTHRALADARATVDVLHALLGRMTGVRTLGELTAFAAGATTAQQRRRHLARDMPHGPGVYLFADATGRVLYVGSAGDLRARVRSYFNRGEKRRRTAEMVALADAVRHVSCPTLLEARVRQVRLIASLKPTYNRRSRTSGLESARAARVASLQRTGRVVAAVRDTAGGWEIAHVVGGRLIGTAVSPPGTHPQQTIDLLVAGGAVDAAQPTLRKRGDPLLDEVDLVWHWLSRPGVRLVDTDQGWWLPIGSESALTGRSLPPSRPAAARRHRRRSPRGHASADPVGPT